MTVNLKSVHLSSFGIGLQKILSQLGVELQRQAENDKVQQFGHYSHVKMNELFSLLHRPFPMDMLGGGLCWTFL